MQRRLHARNKRSCWIFFFCEKGERLACLSARSLEMQLYDRDKDAYLCIQRRVAIISIKYEQINFLITSYIGDLSSS